VLPVHIFGQPCDMLEFENLCRERNLLLLEDACEAVGAEYCRRKIGTFGKATVFSFYPNKQITMGEGAVITTNDPEWVSLLRSPRNQGRNEMQTGRRLSTSSVMNCRRGAEDWHRLDERDRLKARTAMPERSMMVATSCGWAEQRTASRVVPSRSPIFLAQV
jgi:dTDP-4-amino-4,6-dideoxygalactose transaminase